MITELSDLTGNILIIIGSFFLFSAGLGVLRMPDTYNRIQTGTKATTLGTILVLIGLAFLHPAWALKLFILIFFVIHHMHLPVPHIRLVFMKQKPWSLTS